MNSQTAEEPSSPETLAMLGRWIHHLYDHGGFAKVYEYLWGSEMSTKVFRFSFAVQVSACASDQQTRKAIELLWEFFGSQKSEGLWAKENLTPQDLSYDSETLALLLDELRIRCESGGFGRILDEDPVLSLTLIFGRPTEPIEANRWISRTVQTYLTELGVARRSDLARN